MSHTAGPWTYDMKRDTHDSVIYQVGADQRESAKKFGYIGEGKGCVVGSSEWIWIREDDARLIAAAPDLLAALHALMGRVRGLLDVEDTQELWRKLGPEYRQAEAIIRKAVGQ